jgi:rubredoxin
VSRLIDRRAGLKDMETDSNHNEIDLYDELLAFSELPPEQQVAAQSIEEEAPVAVFEDELSLQVARQQPVAEVAHDDALKFILEYTPPEQTPADSFEDIFFGAPVEESRPEPVISVEQMSSSEMVTVVEQPVLNEPVAVVEQTTPASLVAPAEEERDSQAVSPSVAPPAVHNKPVQKKSDKSGTRITVREDTTQGMITLSAEELLAEEDDMHYSSNKTEAPPTAHALLEKVSGPLSPPAPENEPDEMQEEKKKSGPIHVAGPAKNQARHQMTGDLLKASGPLKITGFLNEPPPPRPTESPLLAICPACGHQSDRQAIICMECGYLFDEQKPQEDINQVCADCGSKIRSDEMFCPTCGSILFGE